MQPTADVFTAISTPTRREMLVLLQEEKPVLELAKSFNMTLSAVSQHLAVLREAGLVTQRKRGKQRLYKTNPEPLRAIDHWLETYKPFWTEKLTKLGEYLEKNP